MPETQIKRPPRVNNQKWLEHFEADYRYHMARAKKAQANGDDESANEWHDDAEALVAEWRSVWGHD